MSTKLDGKLVYDWADVEAGRCSPSDLWTPLPPREPPTSIAPVAINPRVAREYDNAALDAAIRAQASVAATGDVQAARALVALTERRAKLLGLDAPKEYSVALVSYEGQPVRTIPTPELERMLLEEATDVPPPEAA